MASKSSKGPSPITFDAIENLAFDDADNLYWCGPRMVTEQRITLRSLELILVFFIRGAARLASSSSGINVRSLATSASKVRPR